MASKVFKWLIPVYFVWLIVHMVLFIKTWFGMAFSGGMPNFASMGGLFLSHFLLIGLGLAFMIYMIVDCAKRKFKEESSKIIWIVVIVLLSVLGATVYYYVHGKNPR